MWINAANTTERAAGFWHGFRRTWLSLFGTPTVLAAKLTYSKTNERIYAFDETLTTLLLILDCASWAIVRRCSGKGGRAPGSPGRNNSNSAQTPTRPACSSDHRVGGHEDAGRSRTIVEQRLARLLDTTAHSGEGQDDHPAMWDPEAVVGLWATPEWLHCYALPELQESTLGHEQGAPSGSADQHVSWMSNSLAMDESMDQQAWRLSEAASLLLHFHSELQAPKGSFGEAELQDCLSAAQELAEVVVPILDEEMSALARGLAKKVAARRCLECQGAVSIASLVEAERLLLQMALVAASQHLIPHVEREADAGRLPVPHQSPLANLEGLFAYLDQLGREQAGPASVHLQVLLRVLRPTSDTNARHQCPAVQQWRRAHAVWFRHYNPTEPTVQKAGQPAELGGQQGPSQGLEDAPEVLQALEAVLLGLGWGDDSCLKAAQTLRHWRCLLEEATPAYVELIVDEDAHELQGTMQPEPTWQSPGLSPIGEKQTTTSCSPLPCQPASEQQSQGSGSGGTLPTSPINAVEVSRSYSELQKLESMLESANNALMDVWDQHNGLVKVNRKLETDLHIVAEEAALAHAVIDEQQASVPQDPSVALELQRSKDRLEGQIVAMAAEAIENRIAAERLLEELREHCPDDVAPGGRLAASYRGLLEAGAQVPCLDRLGGPAQDEVVVRLSQSGGCTARYTSQVAAAQAIGANRHPLYNGPAAVSGGMVSQKSNTAPDTGNAKGPNLITDTSGNTAALEGKAKTPYEGPSTPGS